MYSATFALIVISVIAVTNLFSGFATAILMGRGPKRWSDIEQAIVLQPVSLGKLRPAPRPDVDRFQLPLEAAPEGSPEEALPEPEYPREPFPEPAETVTQQIPEASEQEAPEASSDLAPDAPEASTNVLPEPPESLPRKFILPPQQPVNEHDNDEPEKTLGRQIESWRHGDLCDETPSMSALKIRVEDAGFGGSDALANAVFDRIKRQVRKDRRVLRFGHDQFAWFSGDVPPEDALLPVERIRQMLVKTTFLCQGVPVAVTVAGAVVAGRSDDDSTALLDRLNNALLRALASDKVTSCLDDGTELAVVDAYPVEVEETECAI